MMFSLNLKASQAFPHQNFTFFNLKSFFNIYLYFINYFSRIKIHSILFFSVIRFILKILPNLNLFIRNSKLVTHF